MGEYWDSLSYTYGQMDYSQDAHRQRIIDWINATGGNASAFDVTTKGILHAVRFLLSLFESVSFSLHYRNFYCVTFFFFFGVVDGSVRFYALFFIKMFLIIKRERA